MLTRRARRDHQFRSIRRSKLSVQRELLREEIKTKLRDLDGDYCFYCGSSFESSEVWVDNPNPDKGKRMHIRAATLDHVVPICKNKAPRKVFDVNNLVLSCIGCNNDKGPTPFTDFVKTLNIFCRRRIAQSRFAPLLMLQYTKGA